MEPKIIRPSDLTDFYTEERCHISEIYNRATDRSHSLARTRVEPGVTTAWHRLKEVSEIYYILCGVGLMEVGEKIAEEVSGGDSVFIPKNIQQRITNTGKDDLIFLCICAPAFSAECYEDLEVDH